jgi:hypothetical protein
MWINLHVAKTSYSHIQNIVQSYSKHRTVLYKNNNGNYVEQRFSWGTAGNSLFCTEHESPLKCLEETATTPPLKAAYYNPHTHAHQNLKTHKSIIPSPLPHQEMSWSPRQFCLSGFRSKIPHAFLMSTWTLNIASIITSLISTELVYFLTYLFTPWSRVLLEKLTGFSASQEIPRRFITAIKSAPPPVPILSHIDPVHTPHPTSWRSS